MYVWQQGRCGNLVFLKVWEQGGGENLAFPYIWQQGGGETFAFLTFVPKVAVETLLKPW